MSTLSAKNVFLKWAMPFAYQGFYSVCIVLLSSSCMVLCMRPGLSLRSCCHVLRSFMCFVFVPLVRWEQVAFWPDKHPPLSQYSPELTLGQFIHTLFVCVFIVRLLWQLPPLTVLWLYTPDSGAPKPDEVIQLCILSNWQAVAILCGLSARHAHTPDVSRVGHYLWHS